MDLHHVGLARIGCLRGRNRRNDGCRIPDVHDISEGDQHHTQRAHDEKRFLDHVVRHSVPRVQSLASRNNSLTLPCKVLTVVSASRQHHDGLRRIIVELRRVGLTIYTEPRLFRITPAPSAASGLDRHLRVFEPKLWSPSIHACDAVIDLISSGSRPARAAAGTGVEPGGDGSKYNEYESRGAYAGGEPHLPPDKLTKRVSLLR